MFDERAMKKMKAMAAEWQRQAEEMLGETELNATNDSGIPLKPAYTPADIEGLEYEELPPPGQYPYTRDNDALHYQIQPWVMRHGYGYGRGEDTRQRKDFLESLGMAYHVGEHAEEKPAPYTLLIDLPTQQGYDPDAPEAQGKVGECGLSISNMWELERLFDGKPIDKTEVIFITPDSALPCIAQYIVYGENRGIPAERLRLKSCNIWYHQWFWDSAAFPPRQAIKLGPELTSYLIKKVPMAQVQSITGYNPGEAGATPVQEAALTLATAIAVTEECIKVGLDPDDFVPHFYGHDHLSLDIFETAAKFRAKRRMWAKTFRDRFGCKRAESLKFKTYPQTAGSLLPAQEPLNNIIRACMMTLAGVLGGVDGIWTASYDEALNIPSEEAVTLALRTHQILYHETNIPHVTDPLGGSYYVEWLTNKIEEEATKLLNEIEERGGYLKCWEEGWLRRELERSANRREKAIRSGERVIVGVNKYATEEALSRSAMFRVDPEAEEKITERVKEFRTQRNNEETKAALAEVRRAVLKIKEDWPSSCGILMPALIEAFRSRATVGEAQGIIKEVLGYGYTY